MARKGYGVGPEFVGNFSEGGDAHVYVVALTTGQACRMLLSQRQPPGRGQSGQVFHRGNW
jgi:hypothetical protein